MKPKILLFTLLLFVFGTVVYAQSVSNYTFASTSGTFTATTGGTSPTLTSGNTDDGWFDGLPIGFDFWYLGIRYTTLSATTNGYMSFGANITSSTYVNSLTSSGSPRPVIAPLWDDLEIQATTNVTYLTSGSAGNRIFTLQFLNSKWNYVATAAGISYQVKLYESSGKIEFVYRPEAGVLTSASASIGISSDATGSGSFRSLNSAGASPTVSSTSETTTIATKPSSGRIYAFTPAVPTAPSNLVFSSIGANSMAMSWTDNASNELGYVIYKSTDGVNYTFLEQKAANTTTTVATGLTPSTTYYWRVYAVTEGGLSTALSGSQATICNGPSISQIPSSGLIGNYRFRGNASDETGINQGTLQGSPTGTADRFGIANRAYSFNGSSQYVTTTVAYNNPSDFTISIWFKTATATGGKLIGFGSNQTGTSSNFDRHLYMNNAGQIYFGVYPNAVKTINSPASYNDNAWHLATATLSAAGMVLYMDGAAVASDPTTTSAENFTGYWRIGFDNNSSWTSQPGSFYFSGTLDDALIYQRALSASEANLIYTNPDGASNNGPVCAASTLSLTATTVASTTYAWSGPNGFTSALQNPTLTFSAPYAGVYALTATLAGCSTMAYTIVTASTSNGQWTGNTSTDWATASNWCTGAVPTASTDVIIAAGATNMPNISSSVACKNLTINTGATVTTASGGTLNIAGTLTNNGTMTNSGATNFNGTTGQQSFTGVTAFNHLTLNNTAGLLLPNAISVKNLTLGAGTLNANNFNITVSGDWTNNAATTALTAGTGTVTFNGTVAQAIGGSFATTFNNLSISNTGNTVSLGVNAAITGNLNVGSGTLDLGAYTANRSTAGGLLMVNNNATLKIGGTNSFPSNYATNNLLTASTVEYGGTNQTVANQTYGNVTLSSASGAAVKTMPGSAFTVAGNLTSTLGAGSSVSYTAAAAVTINGVVNIGASTTFNGGSYTHFVSGNWVNNGTFTGNASTVTMMGTGTNISGTGTHNFFNLSIAGAQETMASNSNITVGGNLLTQGVGDLTQASGGTLTMSGSSKTISGTGIVLDNLSVTGTTTTAASFKVTGNLTVIGSLTASGGTINLSGTGKTISGAGTIGFSSLVASGSTTCTANFSIGAALSVSGSLTATAGVATFTSSSSLNGMANLYNVTLNCTSMLMGSNSVLGVANALTVTAGILDVTNEPNTVNFNGSGAQTVNALDYYNLILSGGNTKTAGGTLELEGDITIGPSTTFNGSSATIEVESNWINQGTFVPATSTVIFDEEENSVITGATTFNIVGVNKALAAGTVTLASNISVPTLNMTAGTMRTNANTVTITNTRTGNGVILGNIQRTHSFTTGVAYAFESPANTITFASVSSVSSVLVSVSLGTIGDFPFGGSISRVYNISVPAGTYNATLRLHYQDAELNGNTESSMALWHYNGSAWVASGKTGNSTTSDYVEQSGLTNITNRWTCSDNSNVVRWNGSMSSNWNTAANWTVIQGSASAPPAATDIVDLGSATFTNQPTISNAVTVKNIVFGSAQAVTLTLASGGSLTSGDIDGVWTGNATHNLNVGNQTLTVNGDLELSDGINGHAIHLGIGTGTVTLSGTLIERGGANITFTGAGTLNLADDFVATSGTFTPSTGTVVYNGSSNQDIGIVPYYNLSISAGSSGVDDINDTLVVGGNLFVGAGQLSNYSLLTVAGNVTVSSGAIFQNAAKVLVGGNWTNNGLFVSLGGTESFNGTGAQSISASHFGNLDINKASGTATITGDMPMSGDLTIRAGTFDFQGFFLNRDVLGGNASISAGATALITGTNGPNNFDHYALDPMSTIIFNGTGVQYVNFGGLDFGHVIFRNGGANPKVLVAEARVIGNLTIESGATLNADTWLITLYGNWTNNGTFVAATGTVLFSGTSKTTTGVTTFNKGTVTGSYFANDNLTFNDLLEISPTGSFTAGSSHTLTLNGNLQNQGIMSTTGHVVLTGAQAQTLSLSNAITNYALYVDFNGTVPPTLNSTTTPVFGYLTINNSGGVSPSVGWSVGYALTVASGATFNGGAYTHNITGAVTNNGTMTSSGTYNFIPSTAVTVNLGSNFSSTGLVNFGGAGAMTLAGTPTSMRNVLVSNTNVSGITPSSDWLITNDLTVNNGATLHAGNRTHTIGGNLRVNGSWDRGTSTVILNGSTDQEISTVPVTMGLAFYNLTVNKAGGNVTLATNATVHGALTFTAGKILTNNNLVAVASTGSLTGAGQGTGWVNGNLQKYVATGATTCVFEVGDATSYTPIDLDFASVTTAGALQVHTTSTDHPSVTSTNINPTKSLNRYWTLTNSGIGFTQYDATMHFVAADVDAGANPLAFDAAQFDGSTWVYPAMASASNNTQRKATGILNFGDLALGEICNKGTNIVYPTTPYCATAGTATVTLGGTTGGTFSSSNGLTVNATTGAITLASSTAGNYSVNYVIAAGNGCPVYTTSTNIVVTAAPNQTIAYPSSPYCADGGIANPILIGDETGGYSSTAGLSINSTSGSATLASSTAGTYVVSYTVPAGGGCAAYTTTTNLTVNNPINLTPYYDLQSAYKMEETALDATGHNDGTLQNNPTVVTDRFGVANRAYALNGSNQYISTTNAYANPTAFTVSIWFKTTTTSGGRLVGFGSSQTGSSVSADRHLYMNNAGQVYFGLFPSAVRTIHSTSSYNDGNWHIATATLSPATGMTLYMDGAQVAADGSTTSGLSYTGYWKIGYESLIGWTSQPSSNYFAGTVDDVTIYERALSAAEVNRLYTTLEGADNNGPVCTGSMLDLTASTISGATYSWNGPNGFTSSTQNPSFAYTTANAGVYSVQVAAGGCLAALYTQATGKSIPGLWTGAVSIDWATGGNWCDGNVPTSATDVTIPFLVPNMPTISTAENCHDIVIEVGATLTTASAGTLSVAGLLTNSGTMTNNGTTRFAGTGGQQTFAGVSTFYHLTLDNAGGLSLPTAITARGNLSIVSGTLTTNNYDMTVQGNWSNAGTLAAGSGKVVLQGTNLQTVSHTGSGAFYDLKIDKSTNGVALNHAVTVSHALDLAAGYLDLNSRTLTLSRADALAVTRVSGYIVSEQTSNASAMAWAIGTDTTTHIYPFGAITGDFIPVHVKRTAGDMGTVTVSTYPTNALNLPYPVTPTLVTNLNDNQGLDNSLNAVDRFWEVNPTGSNGEATLTFTALASEVGSVANLVAQRYDSLSDTWDWPLPGQSRSATVVTVPNVTRFTTWALTGQNSPFPVNFLEFDAYARGEVVEVRWITATEINSDFFAVQRSADGVTFETAAIVQAAGNSNAQLHYASTDRYPFAGRSYYRVVETDRNGGTTLTNVVEVNFDGKENAIVLEAFPNPTTQDNIQVMIKGAAGETMLLRFTDMVGQVLNAEMLKIDSGAFIYTVHAPQNLSAGIYVLEVSGKQGTFSTKVLVR